MYIMMDLSNLENMEYSGRGIVIGMTPNGTPFVNYTLTGRSPSSQARTLEWTEDGISTSPTDKKTLETGNKALLVYDAIKFLENGLVISNGAQTNLVAQTFQNFDGSGYTLKNILKESFRNPYMIEDIDVTAHEPDSPIFTPRITGILKNNLFAFGICRRDENGETSRVYSNGTLKPGQAHFVSTYKGGNESPIVLPFDLNSALDMTISENDIGKLNSAFTNAIVCDRDKHFFVASTTVGLNNNKFSSYNIINRGDL